jgi:hypothetical protein
LLLELVRTCVVSQTGRPTEKNVVARNPNMAEREQGVKVVHIRFEGRSLDVPQSDLDVGTASSDNDVKRALARYLEVPEAKLRDYVIDRHDTGNMTVRPEAVFG